MSATGSSDYVTPEAQARTKIDEQLVACGWVVQDYKSAAVAAAQGVAVREVPTASGPADYVLFVDSQAVGVIEAKKAGSTLTGVEFQTRKYRTAYPDELPAFEVDGALPFGYESTGAETRFTSGFGPCAGQSNGLHLPSTRDPGPLARGLCQRPWRGSARPASRCCPNSMRAQAPRTCGLPKRKPSRILSNRFERTVLGR